MSRMYRYVLAAISAVSISFSAMGQESMPSTHMQFQTFQTKDGLCHNNVWCALRDHYGFVWFGTENGLTRYDGRTSCNYYDNPDVAGALGSCCVHTMLELGNDLWLGTDTGVYIYRRSNDSFEFFDRKTRYDVTINCEIWKLFKGKDGLIWIATLGQGVFIYDPEKDLLRQNINQTSLARGICEADGTIYINAVQSEVLEYDATGNYAGALEISGTGTATMDCLLAFGGKMWAGAKDVLYSLEVTTGRKMSYRMPYTINCLHPLDDSRMLVGTAGGLFLFDIEKWNCDSISILPDDDDATCVNSIMKDREGMLWVMTRGKGVCFLSRKQQSIQYHPIPEYGTGNRVNCFFEKEDGSILVGADNGIWEYDSETGKLLPEPFFRKMPAVSRVHALAAIDDELWVGTRGNGLYRLDTRTYRISNVRNEAGKTGTIQDNDILALQKSSDGKTYIGTNAGLFRYMYQFGNFAPTIQVGSTSSVNAICEDKERNLWIATSNLGLFQYNVQNFLWNNWEKVFSGEAAAVTGNILSMMQDNDGNMWFGLDGNGLCRYNKEKDRLETVVDDEGVISKESIHSIQEDRSGNIWIAMNKGIAIITTDNNVLVLDERDGFRNNTFSNNASLRTSDGRMLLGDAHGFYSFIPEDLNRNSYAPPVFITSLGVQGEPVARPISNGMDLMESSHVTLPYVKNNFTISVAVLSYSTTSKNRCRYMLQGLDKEWMETTSDKIDYKNLSPGSYTFVAYGINNDGLESTAPATLTITIASPWWMSTIAILIYLLLFIGLVILVMYLWNKRLEEQYRKRQEEEVNKSKIQFFTNLVHEIRTPLSMICLPLERLKNENGRDDKYIQIIDKNVEYLLSITNQLLEFQKMDSTHLDLNKTEFHIKKLLDDLRKQFDTAGSKEDMELILEAPEEDLIIYADKDRVRTILINLLNNAVKHAVSRIRIALTYGSEQIEVRVENDGTPIPDNEKEKIFDLFYQVKGSNNAALGTGIGLSFSKQLAEAHGGRLVLNDFEGGASFSLVLPREKAPATTFFENMNKVVDQAVTPSDDTLIDDKDESCTILVVEDNPGLLKLVSDSLGRWYNVLSAACGEDALKLLESNDVTIVVSDVMMPGISGIELCQQIRSDINTSHIPVILLTAKTTVESKVEGMEAGAMVYMEKPFSMRQLHLQIENLRSLRRALGEEKDLQAVTSAAGSNAADFALGTRDMEFIKKLNKAVEERIKADGCNVDMVADMMNMSRRSFHRKVMALFGMTPNNYILKYKMQMAAKLLDDGYRASEVTDMLHFSATSYFAKCFKAEYGVNPKEYQGVNSQHIVKKA